MNTSVLHNTARTRWFICLFFGVSCMALAEKSAEPSDELLAYLGDMEDSDDNWSDFADQHAAKPDVHSQSSSASSSSSLSHANSKPASDRSRT